MSAAIIGMGTWLPETVRGNDAWPPSFFERGRHGGDRVFNDIPRSEDAAAAALMEKHLAAEALDPMLGARQRHVADAKLTSAEAEAHAARAALADAGVDPLEVDLVVSYAVVPDRVGPTNAPEVTHLLGAKRATAINIDTGCAAALSQLELARAYVDSGLAKVVLLTQSHLMLRAFPMEHPAAPGLGDAASALVVARRPGLSILSTFTQTHGEHALSVLWTRTGVAATDNPWYEPGIALRVGSRWPSGAKFLMRETVTLGASAVRDAAQRAGVDLQRVEVLASVQPRGFIPPAIAEHLGLPRERAVTTYEEIAHVGACGPVFNLMRARREGRLGPGALAALYAQGAGFTRAAAIVQA
jgi:3-oxoacyl-[acyl-carrier-protein] synthase-3